MVKIDMDLSGMKIPKKVAGVKVPKRLRKQGKALLAKANSPQGREAIAAGLTIAGAAIARAKANGARAKAARHAQDAGDAAKAAGKQARAGAPSKPGEAGIDPALDLGDAINAGIGALQRFLGGVAK